MQDAPSRWGLAAALPLLLLLLLGAPAGAEAPPDAGPAVCTLQCSYRTSLADVRGPACGLGFELSFLLPALQQLRRRRRPGAGTTD